MVRRERNKRRNSGKWIRFMEIFFYFLLEVERRHYAGEVKGANDTINADRKRPKVRVRGVRGGHRRKQGFRCHGGLYLVFSRCQRY